MQIQTIMTPNPITVGPDDTLAMARELMQQRRIHHLSVTLEQTVVGVLSEGDILRNVSPYANTPAETARDQFTLNKKVHQVMRRRPPMVHAQAPIAAAAKVILDQDMTCVPIVDDAGHLVGIVSWKDLLRFALAH